MKKIGFLSLLCFFIIIGALSIYFYPITNDSNGDTSSLNNSRLTTDADTLEDMFKDAQVLNFSNISLSALTEYSEATDSYWKSIEIKNETEILFILADFFFAGPAEAEGYVAVYWNKEPVQTIDQRFANSYENVPIFVSNASSGTHSLSFRIDGYGVGDASVDIKNIKVYTAK